MDNGETKENKAKDSQVEADNKKMERGREGWTEKLPGPGVDSSSQVWELRAGKTGFGGRGHKEAAMGSPHP